MEITNYKEFLHELAEYLPESVALYAGVSPSTVRRMLQGRNVSLQSVEAIANTLGKTVRYRVGTATGTYRVLSKVIERANWYTLKAETGCPVSTTACHSYNYYERPSLSTLAKWASYYDIEVAVV